jgi:endonuclease/exonuclease/phosphatase (EEP) superfamily protein YafD
MGGHGWAFELVSHFRVQLLTLSAIAFVAGAFASSRIATLLAAAALVANAWALGSAALAARSAQAVDPDHPVVTVIWANLHSQPDALAMVAAMAIAHRADVVALAELTPGRRAAARAALPNYPCMTPVTGSDRGLTTVIFARTCEAAGQSSFRRPTDVVYVDLPTLRIIALHPRPPMDAARAADRNEAIAVGAALKAADRSTLMVGDFNATPYSVALSPIASAGLQRASCRGPWAGTWLSDNPLFGLPIDQAYLSPGLRLISCAVGPPSRSDHRPLIVRVQVGR